MYLSDSDNGKDGKDGKDKADKDGKEGKDGEGEDDEESVDSDDSETKEAKAKEKWERKLYKPTGPDGSGWGDFRKMADQEGIILEELLKIEKAEHKRREKLMMLDKMKDQKIA